MGFYYFQEVQKWTLVWNGSTQVFDFVGNKAKGRISKRVLQENKARQVFRIKNISYPLIRTCLSGGKKCSFSGKFGVLCFLATPALRFALLPYSQRLQLKNKWCLIAKAVWFFKRRLRFWRRSWKLVYVYFI